MNYWTEIQKEKLFDMRKASKAKIIERIQNLKKRQDEKNKNLNSNFEVNFRLYCISSVRGLSNEDVWDQSS